MQRLGGDVKAAWGRREGDVQAAWSRRGEAWRRRGG